MRQISAKPGRERKKLIRRGKLAPRTFSERMHHLHRGELLTEEDVERRAAWWAQPRTEGTG